MKNFYRKALSGVFSLLLLLAIGPVNVLAESTTGELVAQSVISGTLFNSIENYYDGSCSNGNVFMKDLTLSLENQMITLDASYTNGNQTQSIESVGTVYGFLGGAQDGKIYLIDFQDTQTLNFVRTTLNVDTSSSSITFLLEDASQVVEFSFSVNENFVDVCHSISQNEDKEKTLNLYKVENNLSYAESAGTQRISGLDSVEASFTSYDYTISTVASRATAETTIPYRTWTSFFDALNSNGYTYLDSYAIDTDVILSNGWTNLTNGNSVPYAVGSYSTQNGTSQRLIQIFRINLTSYSDAETAELRAEVVNLMSLSYDENTEKIEVLYYDYGPYLTDVMLAIQCPTDGLTVFRKEEVEVELDSTPDMMGLFAALIPEFGTISNIWDVLDGGEYVRPSSDKYTRSFEPTYELQIEETGKATRGIAVSSDDYEMNSESHYMVIEGTIVDGYEGCTSWAFRYTANAA